jgi:homoserine dehydrogenase
MPQPSLAVIGVGGVGAAFLSQVSSLPSSIRPSVIFVSRSSKQLYNKDYSPVDPSSLQSSSSSKLSLDELASYLASSPSPVCLVDNTSNQSVADSYPLFLSKGVSVITPNKKAFSSDLKLWKAIFSSAQQGKACIYHESSVGAGLPVISSLNDLIRTCDQVTRIEGVFSGTMSFLFNSFAPATPGASGAWSKIVSEAKAAGYTEPDPRDDLNGMDVARKLTILARIAGLEVEGPESFPVQSLIPEALASASSSDEFMQELPEHDSEMENYKSAAEKEGKLVRYVGSIDVAAKKVKVGLEMVDKAGAIGGLKGSDNLICFYTKRYGANPLVIQGAGAGNEVTAMGVMSDLLKVIERTK